MPNSSLTTRGRESVFLALAKLFLFFYLSSSAFGATYFIDFNAANDNADGTTKGTAWKRCPGMVGFSHSSYVHQAGDRFIFIGGGVWPASVLTWTISNSGSSATPDYYGVDQTWFIGSAWSQPTIDNENGCGSLGKGVYITGINILVDNFLFYRYTAGAGPTAIWSQVYIENNDPNYSPPLVKIANSHWRATNQNANLTGARCVYKSELSHVETDYCEFEQSDLVHHNDVTGNGILDTVPNVVCSNADVVSHCWFHHTVNALLGNGEWHHSEFGPMNHAYSEDGDVHGNAMEPFANTDGYNNYIHDLAPTVEAILTDPATTNPNIHFFFNFFNNLLDSGNGKGISFDFRRAPHNTVTSRACNNTVVNASIGMADPSFMLLTDLRNNHVINGGIQSGSSNTTTVVSNNLIQTTSQATAAGYTAVTRFQPTSSSAPTVLGAPGVNISSLFRNDLLDRARPSSGGWNIGAYEFSGSGGDTTAPTVNITAPSTGATVSGSISVTATASDNVAVGSVQFLVDGVLFSTDSSSPFSATLDTTTLANGSRTITAIATDTSGNRANTSVTVTVNNSAPANTPSLSVSPTALTFPDTAVGSASTDQTFAVTNNGQAGSSLVWSVSGLSGDYSFTGATNGTLAQNASATVTVHWVPSSAGAKTATVVVSGAGGANIPVSGLAYPVMSGLSFSATAGVIVAPFTVTGGTISQSSEQLVPTNGGKAAYGVPIPATGDYTVSATVTAATDSTNSCFINFGSEPGSPTMIWDVVNFTTAPLQSRTASWRGNGAFDQPEFVPKIFHFNGAATQELILRGREANMAIGTITVAAVSPMPSPPAAPTNPSPASGATNVSISTAFSWTGDSAATSYDIKLGTTNPPSIAQSGLTVTSYTRPTALAYSTLYYMSVTAHGQGGNTDSALWSFTTEAKPIIFPTVSLTAPANGVTYIAPATINLAATATDSDGSITKVEFYNGATLLGQDLTSPYALSLTNVAVGDYSYIAKATDNDGNATSSSPVAVHVMAPPQFPVVNLSAPVDGAVYTNAPATIAFTATAADADGTVTKVEFYNGSTKIGEDTTSPYAYNWPNVGAGTYAVKARAIDNGGNATDTAVANITVTLPNAVLVPKVIQVIRPPGP
jgi:hypothetical protein